MIYYGYIKYIIILFIISALFILRFDVKLYDREKMKREKKVARFIGWLNLTLGGLMYVLNWAYQMFFW